ncbi:MAG: sulfotransferase [Bacteroidota bacterium]
MEEYYTELDKKIIIGQKERHLDARQLNDIPIFFIVGRPRSGTTLLRTLFDAHPNVVVPPECQFIINLYPKYGNIKQWTSALLKNFYNELVSQWYFDLWPLSAQRLHEHLMQCEGEYTYGTICKIVYHEYQSVFQHGMILSIGDKNPGYTIYTEKLLKIFPEAKFIHIIRDYRDNFFSIKNVDFELPLISLTVSKWKIFIKRFRKAKERYPESHLEIRYEDLVAEPEKQFRGLCNFIGIPFSKVPFDFYLKAGEARKLYPEKILLKYQSSLFKKISTNRIGLWKENLSQSEIRLGDAAAGDYAALYGYKKHFNKSSFMTRIMIIPGVCFAGLLSLATSIVDRLPYKMRMAILIKAPWIMGRIYLSLFDRKKLKEISLSVKKKSDLQQNWLKPTGLS